MQATRSQHLFHAIESSQHALLFEPAVAHHCTARCPAVPQASPSHATRPCYTASTVRYHSESCHAVAAVQVSVENMQPITVQYQGSATAT
jgi:hypothetical protein